MPRASAAGMKLCMEQPCLMVHGFFAVAPIFKVRLKLCVISLSALLAKNVSTEEFDSVLSMNLDADRHPARVDHRLIGFADIDLQLIVVAPCDYALCTLCQSGL